MFTIILFLVSKVDVSANLDCQLSKFGKDFSSRATEFLRSYNYFAKIPSNLWTEWFNSEQQTQITLSEKSLKKCSWAVEVDQSRIPKFTPATVREESRTEKKKKQQPYHLASNH